MARIGPPVAAWRPASFHEVRQDGDVPVDVRHLVGVPALASVGEAFDELTAAVGCPVTARRTWLQAWVDCYAPTWTAWVPVVERDGLLLAAAPLARRRRAGLLQVRGIGFGRTDDVRLPVRDAGAAAALADAVADGLHGRGPWVLDIEQLPVDDPVVDALVRRLPGARLVPGDGMPTVHVVDRDPRAYLSKNSRKALAKIANRLKAAGLAPEVRWSRDAAEVAALLPEMAAVHRARDADMGRRSDHSDPRAAAFYEQVALRHAERGEVEVLTVRLGGDLAAYVLGFRDGRALRSWDNRLAPRWAEYSAGRLANTEALTHVVTTADLDELDWMRGEEPYKLQTATEVVPTVSLRAWSSPSVRRLDDAVERAREAKRSSPAVGRAWAALAAVRDRAGRR